MSVLRDFEYGHDGLRLIGQLAMPAGPGPHPGVLVMHDAMGLGDVVRRRTRDLAAMGYVALATDMYGAGQATPDRAKHGALFGALQSEPELLRGRVLAGFDALRALEQVEANHVAAIGFCFGGQCVLELARSGAAVQAVVSFHGLLTTQRPARSGEVKAKILALTGARDPYAPLEHVQAFQSELTAARADWQVTLYGEGWHAFTDPDVSKRTDTPGVGYDPLLDRLSWAQATAFLEATLGA